MKNQAYFKKSKSLEYTCKSNKYNQSKLVLITKIKATKNPKMTVHHSLFSTCVSRWAVLVCFISPLALQKQRRHLRCKRRLNPILEVLVKKRLLHAKSQGDLHIKFLQLEEN